MSEPRRIGIGLVAVDGRYLVRRRPGPPLAGYWEFPGGKCEPGETPREAAGRECFEELGFAVILAEQPRQVVLFDYPDGSVELYFFDARPVSAESQPTEASGFRWIASVELQSLRFPEANASVLAELSP